MTFRRLRLFATATAELLAEEQRPTGGTEES
jgi:hypothetical protein